MIDGSINCCNREPGGILVSHKMVIGHRYPVISMEAASTQYGDCKKVKLRDGGRVGFSFLSKKYSNSVTVELMDEINLNPTQYSLIFLGRDASNSNRFKIV